MQGKNEQYVIQSVSTGYLCKCDSCGAEHMCKKPTHWCTQCFRDWRRDKQTFWKKHHERKAAERIEFPFIDLD